jgi:hypothetical protein
VRTYFSFAAISVLTTAALLGCGDDTESGTPAGNAGAGGNGGGGGSSGSAGNGGTAGAVTTLPPALMAPPADCTGCVQLTVSVPATITDTMLMENVVQFQFPPPPATTPPFDLSQVTAITWRIRALTNDPSFFVRALVQNSPPEAADYNLGALGQREMLTADAFPPGSWKDVILDLSANGGADAGVDAGDASVAGAGGLVAAGGSAGAAGAGGAGPTLTAFDKSKVRVFALNVGSIAPAAGLVSVEVQSVTLTGTSPNFSSVDFSTGLNGLTANNYLALPGTPFPPAPH